MNFDFKAVTSVKAMVSTCGRGDEVVACAIALITNSLSPTLTKYNSHMAIALLMAHLALLYKA